MREGLRPSLDSPSPDSPCIAAVRAGAPEAIILGFDFGLRRIGVALGNSVTRSARPLAVVTAASVTAPSLWRDIAGLLAQWQPGQLVVGIARHPDGSAHEMTRRCERFARQLEGRFGLPVARVDERYSTAVLPANAATDDHAAAVILQQWFDEPSQGSANAPARAGAPTPGASDATAQPAAEPAC
jgi:putative Holliday junction resolvase